VLSFGGLPYGSRELGGPPKHYLLSGAVEYVMRSPIILDWKTYALLGPMILFASTGNVLLGKGMKQIGKIPWSLSELSGLFVRTFINGWVWLGIGSLLLFLVSFMVVLSWADYSFVMPASAASYAVATLMSHWLLGELVTLQRWAGVAFICLGVALVTRTPSSSRG
jgi:drug/metabolite transporter (DMT)-like permease